MKMNAELLAERNAFKRKAMAIPTVENVKKSKKDEKSKKNDKANLGALSQSAKAKLEMNKMKAMSSVGGGGGGASAFKFSVLAKIVRHMKSRHMDGMDHPLTLDDILDETNQTDVGSKTRLWLQSEALGNNPKIMSNPDGTYIFKPPYSIMNRKGLLKLLKQHDLRGMGGIFYEDVAESLPKCEKIVRNLHEEQKIIVIKRPVDKKEVMFYHDHTSDFKVDDEFQKLWRSVTVDSLDDEKIDEYLEKQGIRSMQDLGIRRPAAKHIRKKGGGKRKNRGPKDNDHLKDVLEDYQEMSVTKRDK